MLISLSCSPSSLQDLKSNRSEKIFFPKTKTVKLNPTAQLERVSQVRQTRQWEGVKSNLNKRGVYSTRLDWEPALRPPAPNQPKQNTAPDKVNTVN